GAHAGPLAGGPDGRDRRLLAPHLRRVAVAPRRRPEVRRRGGAVPGRRVGRHVAGAAGRRGGDRPVPAAGRPAEAAVGAAGRRQGAPVRGPARRAGRVRAAANARGGPPARPLARGGPLTRRTEVTGDWGFSPEGAESSSPGQRPGSVYRVKLSYSPAR